MGDWEDQLNRILNDPEQMAQLSQMARSLMGGGEAAEPAPRHPPMRVPASRLERLPTREEGRFERFCMGDSVQVLPEKKTAIVYKPADDEGNVVVQLQGRKVTVRHNRLRLLVPSEQLYPPDYDFSIIFDTVANRKAAHTMARKHDPSAVIVVREGAPEDRETKKS